MPDHNSAFFKRSQRIAEGFLQTTVVIDDQIKFRDKSSFSTHNSDGKTVPNLNAELESITRGPRGSTEPLVVSSETQGRKGSSHDFYADDVINSFAEKNIVCSVIDPTSNPSLINTFIKLAKSADVIVVDWDLNVVDPNGETALNILEHICESAVESLTQLRLFVIYTGDPGIAEIVETIKSTLSQRLSVKIDDKEGGFVLTFNSIRIVVFAKPDTTNIPPEYEDRKIPFNMLVDRVILEFTQITAGLVSNTAVRSLTHIRQNTFKILGRFSKDLDAPFLTHRLLQPTPTDVEDHLLSLISQEFYAILDEAQVGQEAGINPIEDWLKWRDLSELKPAKNSSDRDKKNKSYGPDEILELFRLGSQKLDTDMGKYSTKSVYKHTTAQLAMDSNNVETLDNQFAMLSCLRSFFEGSSRTLSLGTILQKQSSNDKDIRYEYLLCIQPLCDTIRLDKSRAFPFIPLIEVSDGKFNTVIFDVFRDQYVHLVSSTKPYEMKLIDFSPSIDSERVVFVAGDNTHVLNDVEDTEYRWIGELRSEHAMRIIQVFVSNMSRIGLNESEWLRLSGS